MKKIIKIIFFILLLVIILLVINNIRNFILLNNIWKNNNEFELLSNYYALYEIKSEMGNSKSEYYRKDSIYLVRHESWLNNQEGKNINIYWKNIETNEHIALETDANGNLVNREIENINWDDALTPMVTLSLNKREDVKFSNLIIANMFNFIKIEDNCYNIKATDFNFYINKDTKLIEKIIYTKNENTEIYITYRENNVTDENVEKPVI